MSSRSIRLICPRCRQLGPAGDLEYHPLEVATVCPDRDSDARAGALACLEAMDAVQTLRCPNDRCRSAYPVIAGIPIIFAVPGSLDLQHNPPVDLSSIPMEVAKAMMTGEAPDAPLASQFARLSRYAWAGFHDWTNGGWGIEGVRCEVHAVEVMRWLEAFGEPARCEEGARIVLGAGLGREAWEAGGGDTVLLDGHLPSLFAARRLLVDGRLPLLVPVSARRWEIVTIEAPGPPGGNVALVCGDALDPPFEAEVFSSTIATNLIDSVSDPYLALGQAHALTAARGLLAITTPFAWRPEVTEPDKWLETMTGRSGADPDEVLEALMQEFEPGIERLDRRRFSWALRTSAREAVVYQSTGWCYARGGVEG